MLIVKIFQVKTAENLMNDVVKTSSIVSMLVRVFCLSLIIFMMNSCKYVDEIFPQISPEEIEEVKKNCNDLVVPPTFVKVRQHDLEKSGLALRSIQYSSYFVPNEVEEHFVKNLTSQGWSYTKEMRSGTDYLRFQRGKFSIVIEYQELEFTSNRTYGVGCSWGIY